MARTRTRITINMATMHSLDAVTRTTHKKGGVVYSQKTINEAAELFKEYKELKPVSEIMELSKTTLNNWRKKYKWGDVRNNRPRKKHKKGDNICTCCGIREKINGFRFLCEECYTNHENAGDNEHRTLYNSHGRTMYTTNY